MAKVSLDDKYLQQSGRVYLTGSQALVRLTLMQRLLDTRNGLNTAAYVSGYRGSPLGNVDKTFWQAEKFLKPENVKFHAGLNEDLAATAIWGSQQVNLFEGAKVDGVFGMWYGKGPGVDRTGDVFRHANMAGTSPHGGVLALAGDDPACKSSTVPSQSEYAFMDSLIPIFNPANVQEVIDYGLYGWAMSRFAGVWVAMKTITENMDASASVSIDPDRINIVTPNDVDMPDGGLHIRWPDPPLEQEDRLQRHKIYAALAFARANGLDKTIIDSPEPRLGIVSTGKSFLDVMQALDDLGIDEEHAAEIGLRVYKVAMSWPLEREGIRKFAEGLDEILVVEEKRAVIENQLKEQLYNWRSDVRPRVVGKFDEVGKWVLPSSGELTPARIARVIAARIDKFYTSPRIKDRLEFLERKEKSLQAPRPDIARVPYFCAGCPHNTSTRVPEGSRAVAGIGCHYMVTWMDRETKTFTHMGGEGANWLGQAPFTDTEHVFVNIGDGTYDHSGLLAIRAANAAGVNITYKILYNDAVAMTGGQPVLGQMSVPTIARQMDAEGINRIAVVSDQPDKYPPDAAFPAQTTFHDRHELDSLQREMRQCKGVSILIYDQTCAAEKRRRRKRGLMDDPPERVFINEAVCEGCGDCGVKSNCVAIAPIDTPFGRKRRIDQSSCNKDFSCLDGFCPSFVTVTGGKPKKRVGSGGSINDAPIPPDPEIPSDTEEPYGIVITGIGGTGVVTVGALLGMAAHIEGKGVSVLDMAGLAQKNGAVVTHVRISDKPEKIYSNRIAAGGARLLLGCDLVTSGGAESLAKLRRGYSRAVVNVHGTMTAGFVSNPDMDFPADNLETAITNAIDKPAADFIDATELATQVLGDSIASNLFMVGYAYQKGLLPLTAKSILAAIEVNGVAIDFNKQAFAWGRAAAHDEQSVLTRAGTRSPNDKETPEILDDKILRLKDHLTSYQDAAYSKRFANLVQKVRDTEMAKAPGHEEMTEAVADSYHKLLAFKDEYEVARLYADKSFREKLTKQFDGNLRLNFHLAPPLISTMNPFSGEPEKGTYGPWMMLAFRFLASMKGLRGSVFDPFRWTGERRLCLQLIKDFESTIDEILETLTKDNHDNAVAIAALPQSIRGFGPVKERSAKKANEEKASLLKERTKAKPAS